GRRLVVVPPCASRPSPCWLPPCCSSWLHLFRICSPDGDEKGEATYARHVEKGGGSPRESSPRRQGPQHRRADGQRRVGDRRVGGDLGGTRGPGTRCRELDQQPDPRRLERGFASLQFVIAAGLAMLMVVGLVQ